MATLDDLQGAVNALRAEISGIVAPQIAASITSLRSEVDVTVTSALDELRQHSETTTQRVSVAVDERFQHASTCFSAQQERLNGIMRAEHDRLTQAPAVAEQLLEKLRVDVTTAVEKMGAVSDGKLDEVATAIIEQRAKLAAYEVEQELKVGVIHEILSKEVRSMHGSITDVNTTTLGRMARLEQGVDMQMTSQPFGESRQAPGEARGYQIRIPAPEQWNLTILKNGETGFLP